MVLVENELKNFYIRPPIDWDTLGAKEAVTESGTIKKLPSDTDYFGYIPNIKATGLNWQTNAHNESTTVADQFWQWALYNEDGTVKKTYRQNSSFPRGRAHVGYGVHSWNDSGFSKTLTFTWVNADSSYGLYNMSLSINGNGNASFLKAIGVGGNGKYIYGIGGNFTNDSSTPAFSIVVFNTDTKTGTELWKGIYGGGAARYLSVIETDTHIRCYMATYGNYSGKDGGYVDINKDNGTASAFTSMGVDSAVAFINAHPDGEYSDLDGATLLTNFGTYSGGCFFNGDLINSTGYFKRGWDNATNEYLYKPVFN